MTEVAVRKEYETVVILDPTLDEAREKEEVDRVVRLIEENGGQMGEIERWGRRRLAYEIHKKRDGLYSVLHYHAPGVAVKELERRLRLSELFLRVMTVVIDPRIKLAMEEARIAAEKVPYLDYKDEKRLARFVTDRGKIVPRRVSGTCAMHQRQLTSAIRRARMLAILPFTADVYR